MKNLALLVGTIFSLLFWIPAIGMADGSVQLMVGGNLLKTDVSPQIINGRTLVPVRAISEALGMDVKWNNNGKVTIAKDQMNVQLTIHERNATVNGEVVPMDQPPILYQNRTLVPIRFIAETLGMSVGWDALSKVVLVHTPFSINISQSVSNAVKVFPIKGETYIPLSRITQPFHLKVDEAESKIKVTITSDRNSVTLDVAGSLYANKRSAVRIDQALFVPLSSLEKLGIQTELDLSQKMILLKENTSLIDMDQKYVIVIDPGHGGKDPGAKGIAGNYEKNFTLSLANLVVNELKQHPEFDVIMTRTGDTYPTLQDRVDLANQSQADVFLSIHANSFTPESRGTEVYYTHENSKEFAAIVSQHLLEATGFPNRGTKGSQFFVTNHTTMPAALIEVGFLTNKMENTEMLKPEFQQRVAKSLADAIYEYYRKND